MKCYRNGGCGPYEMYSCADCPASSPEYLTRNKLINADRIRAMSDDELYQFLWNIAQDGPWYNTFDKEFCEKCERIEDGINTYAYCEIAGNECPHYGGDPLRWWLSSE